MEFVGAGSKPLKRLNRTIPPNGEYQPTKSPVIKKAYKPKLPFHTVEGIGSKAWEMLDIGARGLLMEFYKKFNGYNRSNLSVTHREVKHLMSSLLFTRFIWQLIGFGFLDIVRQGRLQRNCSIYALSNRWRSLSENLIKLEKIYSILKEVDKLKRMPGSEDKRREIWRLRKEVFKIR